MAVGLRQYTQLRPYAPLGVYILLALLVLWPLLSRGFIFATDMVFVPHPPMPAVLTPSYPYEALLHWICLWIPADIVQKILLGLIIVLAGLGMHRLAEAWFTESKTQAAYFFAGLLYAVNPFVYSRFMIGQYLILAGYALLPFCLRAVYRLCTAPEFALAVKAAVLLALLGVFSVHMFGIALIASGLLIGFALIRDRHLRNKWPVLIMLTGVLATFTSYWWLPIIFGNSALQSTAGNFNIADARAFSTPGDWWAVLGRILSLRGFWADYQNLYQMPQNLFAWWWLPIAAFWALVGLGGYILKKEHHRLFWPVCSMAIIGVVLAIGVSGTFFAAFNAWLVQHVSFFAGYREPQKFVALICVASAYFGAVGFDWILRRIKGQGRDVVAAVLLVLPFGLAPLMALGFAGQLHATQYPKGWYQAREYLQDVCSRDCQTLVLPWHLYMHYDFAGRIIANPTPKFFGGNIVASTDPEIKGASAYSWTDTQRSLNSAILPDAQYKNAQIATRLKQLHIQYVVLIKGYDSNTYGFLSHQKDITLVKESQSLRIYKVGE